MVYLLCKCPGTGEGVSGGLVELLREDIKLQRETEERKLRRAGREWLTNKLLALLYWPRGNSGKNGYSTFFNIFFF